MTTKRKPHNTPAKPEKPTGHEPVDVIDGVPNRSGNVHTWKYLTIAAVFGAWIGFLILCGITGKL